MRFRPGFTISSDEAPVWLILACTAAQNLTSLEFAVESSAITPNLTQTIEFFDWNTGNFQVVESAVESFNSDSLTVVDVSQSIPDFVSAAGQVISRLGWRKTGFTIVFPWEVAVDQVAWQYE